MARFTINPPNTQLVDAKGYITSPWYRWFSRVNDVLGDDAVAAIAAAPVLTYSATTAFSADKILTQGAGLSFTSGASTLTIALSTSGVTAASYGSASQVGTFTVDQYGRLTAAANVAIAIDASAITSGTLVVARGGTGLSSYTVGDLIYASGATTLSKLADVATGNALISGGVGVAPAWGKIGLATHISGTLAVGNGGSGATTLTGYLVGNGTSAFTAVATIPASDISSAAALTRVDDTNVTLTLGGTPTTALLAATSLTLGWSGTLAVARGGTGGGVASGTLLDNITGFSSTGHLVRTGAGTYAFRTQTGTANQIDVSNGSGVSGNPTFSISATYVGQTSITTLGTVGTGIWQGTAVGAAYGGTGQTSYTVGDILYASAATTLSKLAGVATGNALISGGVATAPSWGKIGLTTHVSGTLGIGNGGTGSSTTFTEGSVVFAGASGVYSQDNSNLFWNDTNNTLGIGTTANTYGKLVVSGSNNSKCAGFVTQSTEDVVYVRANEAGAATDSVYVLPIRTVGTFRGGIQYNGGTGNVDYNTTSDRRLKKNIQDAPETGSIMDAIKVRSFDWRDSGIHQRFGFIAQELESALPELVSDNGEFLAVDYSKFVPLLLKEIQSLRARVAMLEDARQSC